MGILVAENHSRFSRGKWGGEEGGWLYDRRYCVHNIFFGAQGRITKKSMDGYGRNSNSSQILCLPLLPASLMTIRSKMKALLCP